MLLDSWISAVDSNGRVNGVTQRSGYNTIITMIRLFLVTVFWKIVVI